MPDGFDPQHPKVQRHLETGEHDHDFPGWPGDNFIDAARHASATLRKALIAAAHARVSHRRPDRSARHISALTRTRVAPMVAGLFPQAEQATVLVMLECSGVLLTPGNIDELLRNTRWLRTAWTLANLYLLSVGAERLSKEAPEIVGLSQEATCCVSLDYFGVQDPFADFVVDEAAHVFHNCKRGTVGLPQTRRREWLLDIHCGHRETFAYACEAYSRILTLGTTAVGRCEALARHADSALPGDPTVDLDEYLDILNDAVQAHNGWKHIQQRCAPGKAAIAAEESWRSPSAAAS